MNHKYFFLMLLILGAIIIFGLNINANNSFTATSLESASTPPAALTSQSKTIGVVEVDITPVSVEPNQDLIFELAFNNHSIDLNFDVTQISTLSDDQGNTQKPREWTGATGSHHMSGKLIFPALAGQPETITLTLNSIDNNTADFTWQLQKRR